MTASIIQTATNDAQATGGAITCTFASPVTAGNTILVFASLDSGGGASISTIADSVNGSYGAAKITVVDATDGETVAAFLFPNSASGTPTVTLTPSANCDFRALTASEIGGAATASYGGSAGQVQNATGADGVTTGNVTPTGQPALLVALSMSTGNFPGSAPAAGTGFTSGGVFWLFGQGAGTEYSRLESKRVTSTSPVAATFTQVANVAHTQIVVAVLEPSVAASDVAGGSAGERNLRVNANYRMSPRSERHAQQFLRAQKRAFSFAASA